MPNPQLREASNSSTAPRFRAAAWSTQPAELHGILDSFGNLQDHARAAAAAIDPNLEKQIIVREPLPFTISLD